MPSTLPQSVRDSWGEDVADNFSRWLDAYVRDHAVPRDERPDREGGSAPGVYREVLQRLDVLENEVAGVNERLDRMEDRFGGRFDQMENRFNQMDERIDRMHEQMRVMMR